jgi:hypothetical protein
MTLEANIFTYGKHFIMVVIWMDDVAVDMLVGLN